MGAIHVGRGRAAGPHPNPPPAGEGAPSPQPSPASGRGSKKTRRAKQRRQPSQGRAQRWPEWTSPPLWPCREAQGVGRAWAAQQAHASCSDSVRLLERSERSERSEFRSAAPRPSIAGCPQRSGGTRPVGSPFLWLLSFGETKESDCAAGRTSRPAAQPTPRPLTPALSPKGRGSTTSTPPGFKPKQPQTPAPPAQAAIFS